MLIKCIKPFIQENQIENCVHVHDMHGKNRKQGDILQTRCSITTVFAYSHLSPFHIHTTFFPEIGLSDVMQACKINYSFTVLGFLPFHGIPSS